MSGQSFKEELKRALETKVRAAVDNARKNMTEEFKAGSDVTNKKFGKGVVISSKGNMVTVGFDKGEQTVKASELK